jgi:single-strand DNA-binding protein
MTSSAQFGSADNQIYLHGRLASTPVFRDLPSGDVLAVFRVTVARPKGERVRVDSIECATVKARVHKTLARADTGDDVELFGSLRRRFWRTPSGAASRYAVDVQTLRLNRAGRAGAASQDRKPA